MKKDSSPSLFTPRRARASRIHAARVYSRARHDGTAYASRRGGGVLALLDLIRYCSFE